MGLARRIVIVGIVLSAAVYAGDWLRISHAGNAFGSIALKPYYAIHLKNKKIEYDYNVPPDTEVCVESLFPHYGDRPCWYAARHKREKIEE